MTFERIELELNHLEGEVISDQELGNDTKRYILAGISGAKERIRKLYEAESLIS